VLLDIVLHLVVAARPNIVPVGVVAVQHPRRSLAADLVAAVANLASLCHHLQMRYSHFDDTVCRAYHYSERHSDCLVDQGMGTLGELVLATAGRHQPRWERIFGLLWERKSPMAMAQLGVPHRWHRLCSSSFRNLHQEHATLLLRALQFLERSSRHPTQMCATNIKG
jgi:hypothetical protein